MYAIGMTQLIKLFQGQKKKKIEREREALTTFDIKKNATETGRERKSGTRGESEKKGERGKRGRGGGGGVAGRSGEREGEREGKGEKKEGGREGEGE